MKDPSALPRPRIQRPHRPRAAKPANDQEVLVDHSRRIETQPGCSCHIQSAAQIKCTILAKASDGLAGLRVQRVKVIARAGKNPLLASGFVFPEHEPTLPR